MVRTEAQIRDIIFRYVSYLNKQIKVDKVILFGSYAKSSASEDSDIDIAIESPDFGNNYLDDWQHLSRSVWRSGVEPIIEPRPFHSSMDPSILEEITKHGKIVYDSELEA